MSKKLIVLGILMSVSLLGTAFAAVENVKVGGSITAYGVTRSGYDLNHNNNGAKDEISLLASFTDVKFDVDLTEDVLVNAVVRNERVFGEIDNTYFSTGYVTLKNLLGYPLTLKIGLQPIVLGSGLLVADPDTNQKAAAGSAFGDNKIGDLSPRKSFEGITAVFDLSPASLTLGYVKGGEGDFDEDDDINVYAANLAYDYGNNVIGELYYVFKDTQTDFKDPKTGLPTKDDVVNIGVRVVASPVDAVTLNGEYCYQYAKDPSVRPDGNYRSDRALLLGAKYSFLDVTGAPNIGIDYARISENWDPMFEGLTPANIVNALLPNSNVQLIGLTFSSMPVEDLSVKLRYVNLRLTKKISNLLKNVCPYGPYTMNSSKKGLGNEVDLAFVYDYTEDVQIGLNVDYFKPGKAFKDDNDSSAFQALGSLKVSF